MDGMDRWMLLRRGQIGNLGLEAFRFVFVYRIVETLFELKVWRK
jgi:hypothetical protein